MNKIIVVTNPQTFPLKIPDTTILSSKMYITNPELAKLKNTRVFNLTHNYGYQTKGYYVSLLAEARGHKPIPSIKNIKDIKTPTLARFISDDLDELIQRSLRKIKSGDFVLSVYFGRNVSKQYDHLCREFHNLFQVPFLRAKFHHRKKWILQSIKTIGFNEIPEIHYDFLQKIASEYFGKKRYDQKKENFYSFDIAVMVNPHEKHPPSNKKALAKFIEAGEKLGCYVEIVTKEDLGRLFEFDALFIRETTGVNHYTYYFSRKAQNEGLVVVDDPESILKCCNKVYLAELLSNAKLPTPKTMIVHTDNKNMVADELGLPCVLKLPDSSFSLGVILVNTKEQLTAELNKMLESSELVLAQEFLQSEFDWRIGFLDGRFLFACKYYMAKGHWQIYNWDSADKENIEGEFECCPSEIVPENIMKTAKAAANLIGRGLYGVDMKEVRGKPYIIEINDNPNIDAGIEDLIYKDKLYTLIIETIRNRIINLQENGKKI